MDERSERVAPAEGPGRGSLPPGGWAGLPELDVDGGLMLKRAVGFARALNAAGIPTDPGSAIDFARALLLVGVGDRDGVRAAGATVFVRRRDDLPMYEEVFARFWRRRGFRVPAPAFPPPPTPEPADVRPESEDGATGDEHPTASASPTGESVATGEEDDGGEIEGLMISPEAYSHGETIRHKEFDRMSASELREAERLIDLLAPRLERRPTRRYELHRHGTKLAPRVMFRRNLGTGGDLVDWVWRRTVRRPRSIVVICDISGSMERQSRLLLRFVQALSSSPVKTEAFVFGTRLTRVTRLIRDRDRDRGLAKVSEAVVDWAGGTRIGESFHEFNRHWARRVLRTSGIVIVVSDGWDRGDPALVGEETARLARACHRLIWLNPLASSKGYRPLAAGMAAAYPHLDDFVAAGTVASLERLGELLAGIRNTGRGTGESLDGHPGGPRVWRARSRQASAGAGAGGDSVAPGGSPRAPIGRPVALGSTPTPPDVASPLR